MMTLQELMDALEGRIIGGRLHGGGYIHVPQEEAEQILALLNELLKIQPEQKHGHWVLDPDGMDWNIPAWRCSECGCRNDNIPPNLEKTNPRRWSGSRFCPNCGAKMDEGVKQE